MSDKGNRSFFSFIEENWKKVGALAGIVAGIAAAISKIQEDPTFYIPVILGVLIIISFSGCIFYAFFWQPEVNDGRSRIIVPGSNNPETSQRSKARQRKIVRWLAKLGLLLISLLGVSGWWFYQYQAQQPPQDFKILIANFETSDSENRGVTKEIFRNLEREMEKYGEDVKVKRLDKSIKSIKAAKTAGKQNKAAIVIWGDYKVMSETVPISVNFEILRETTDYFELGESVQGQTQLAQLSELNSFQLQINLSQEMTYLSLFTLGMYHYLDDDWEEAIQYYERTLEISEKVNEPIASLGTNLVFYYLGNSSYNQKIYNKALEFYEKVIEINPDYYAAWNNRGNALRNLGKLDEAIISYNKAIKINPRNDAALYNKATVYQ